MKYIYVLALALIMSTGLATNVNAESGKDNNGYGLSNRVELNSDLKVGVKSDDNDNDNDREDDKKGEDSKGMWMWNDSDHNPRVFGTVTAVSGSTITLSSKSMGTNSTTTVYTVNATNAKIEKSGVLGTISSILVGDMISVEGTVNGTTIVATEIKDGKRDSKNPDSMFQSNGQPIIGGKVTAINGSIITVTNKSNVAYTVDMTNAKIVKNGKADVIGSIVIGDTVLAQGTITGTSVVAVSVIDQGSVTNNPNGDNGKHLGFFQRFGNFFARLFGFSK